MLRLHEYNVTNNDTNTKNKNNNTNNNTNNKNNGQGATKVDVDDGGEVKVRVGNVYPVIYATTIATPINPTIDNNHSSITEQIILPNSLLHMNQEEAYTWTKRELTLFKAKADADLNDQQQNQNQSKKKQGKKNKDKGSCSLKMLLLKPSSGVFHYGPSLLEHCILCANIEPSLKFTLDTIESLLPPHTWLTTNYSKILNRKDRTSSTTSTKAMKKATSSTATNHKHKQVAHHQQTQTLKSPTPIKYSKNSNHTSSNNTSTAPT